MRRRCRNPLLVLSALLATAGLSRAGEIPDWKKLRLIEGQIGAKKFAEAAKGLDALLGNAATEAGIRASATELAGALHAAQGKRDEALIAWRMAESITERGGLKGNADLGKRFGGLCMRFYGAGAWGDAVRTGRKAVAGAKKRGDRSRQAEMLAYVAAAHGAKGEAQARDGALAEMRAIAQANAHMYDAASRPVNALLAMGRLPLAFDVAEGCLRANPLARLSREFHRMGQLFEKKGDGEKARRCYLLGAHSAESAGTVRSSVLSNLGQLARLELAQGNRDAALRAARLGLARCGFGDLERAMDGVATVLRAREEDAVERLVDFLDYQRYGAAGKDGREGTEDDLEDPLAEVKPLAAPDLVSAARLPAGLDVLDCRRRCEYFMMRGKYELALGEALAAYRSAAGRSVADEIALVATALKALDGTVARADRYLLYQKHGPAGQDGQAGTADDLADPLKGLAPPLAADRVEALRGAVAQCGHDLRGTLRKGRLLLALGQADEGLRVMRLAYQSCEPDPRSLAQAIQGVAAAVKAVDGHVVRANQYLLYHKHGPAGPDRLKGTADDLANPLPPLAAAAPNGG